MSYDSDADEGGDEGKTLEELGITELTSSVVLAKQHGAFLNHDHLLRVLISLQNANIHVNLKRLQPMSTNPNSHSYCDNFSTGTFIQSPKNCQILQISLDSMWMSKFSILQLPTSTHLVIFVGSVGSIENEFDRIQNGSKQRKIIFPDTILSLSVLAMLPACTA